MELEGAENADVAEKVEEGSGNVESGDNGNDATGEHNAETDHGESDGRGSSVNGDVASGDNSESDGEVENPQGMSDDTLVDVNGNPIDVQSNQSVSIQNDDLSDSSVDVSQEKEKQEAGTVADANSGDSKKATAQGDTQQSKIGQLQTAGVLDTKATLSDTKGEVYQAVSSEQFDAAMQQLNDELSFIGTSSVVLSAALFACFGALCVKTLLEALTWKE